MEENNIKQHPSYAMMEINRVDSNQNTALFGSSIGHSHTIELTIKQADITRKHNKDWIHGSTNLITVEMSYSQFMQAIMSFNSLGTPVTLRYLNNKRIEREDALESKKDLFEKEFQNTINQIFDSSTKSVKLATALLNSSKQPTKADKKEIVDLLYKINQDLKENLKFIVTSFEEQMDKTITESHGEIEAFFDMKIQSLGLESLKQQSIEYNKEIIEDGNETDSIDN